MDPSRGIMSGSCFGNQFCSRFQRMQPGRPGGTGGTGIVTPTYPYAVTPVKEYPYGSSSVGRQPSDAWRYGSGYTGPNPGKVYGEPDYKYNGHEYCGPGGYGPPGYMGDAYGKNPNIRYVQLNASNFMGAGVTPQNSEQPNELSTPTAQTDGSEDSKTMENPLKFQIHIGDINCTNTNPQATSLKVKNRTVQTHGAGGDQDVGQEAQEYPVQIPGQTAQVCSEGDGPSTTQTAPKPKPSALYDPCGNCNACKDMAKAPGPRNVPSFARPPQVICQPQKPSQCQVKGQRGQRYTVRKTSTQRPCFK